MKKIGCVAAAAMLAVSMCGVSACGKKNVDNPETLDIYLLYKGYQDEWLTSTIELFKNEDWVKEKYPNLTVNYTNDGIDSTAGSKLSAGGSINKYDLMFGVNLFSYDATGVTMDLTDALYLSEVPGEEGVKVIDKVPEHKLKSLAAANGPERADGGDSYYTVNYIDGMYSMLYNADILKDLNMQVPVTTKEFMDTCNTIKTGSGYQATVDGTTNTYNTAIMNSARSNYWNSSFSTWWAQYEGYDGYCNFYNGIHNKKRSNEVLKQTGRLRSLETIESIFRSGYSYESSAAIDYKTAQTNFLSGHGVFHYNGDYFASEMRLTIEALKGTGVDYDIRYMKMPVISTVVEQLEYRDGENLMSDTMLAAIVREIDNNVKYDDSVAKTNGVSKKDFNKIAEARQISAYPAANAQTAVVPDYSPAKSVAVDFLRFMYTDKAISSFARAAKGIRFPAKYEYTQEDLASFSSICKSGYEVKTGTSNYPFIELPPVQSFALGKAGLSALASFKGVFEVLWSTPDQTTTALDLYNADITHWNETSWGQMIARAGYSV